MKSIFVALFLVVSVACVSAQPFEALPSVSGKVIAFYLAPTADSEAVGQQINDALNPDPVAVGAFLCGVHPEGGTLPEYSVFFVGINPDQVAQLSTTLGADVLKFPLPVSEVTKFTGFISQ